MIITYLRSSSYNTHSMCAHRFFLEYNLGIKTPTSKAADMGNVVHKAMEVLARVKKAQQVGDWEYKDEIFGWVDINYVTPEWAVEKAYEHYTKHSPHLEWYKGDLKTCKEWTNIALTYNDGMFDPRKRNIVEPEKKFDITINKPWAKYNYRLGNETITGQLGLRGTVDLIVEDTPGLLEVIDYKTGGTRNDWTKNTIKVKEYEDLRYDPQLCLYHYAISQTYPNVEDIMLTIFYIRAGGPFTFCFEKKDLEYTENLLKAKFEEIKRTQIPELNITWKCKKFCFFSSPSEQDPTRSKCKFYADEIKKKGVNNVMIEHGCDGAYNNYGDGGGRKA